MMELGVLTKMLLVLVVTLPDGSYETSATEVYECPPYEVVHQIMNHRLETDFRITVVGAALGALVTRAEHLELRGYVIRVLACQARETSRSVTLPGRTVAPGASRHFALHNA